MNQYNQTSLMKILEELALDDFQIESITRVILDHILENQELKIARPMVCPKCECTSKFYKRGKIRKNGKQRFSCCSCKGWFVYDIGKLTYKSHQSHSVWNQMIIDTLNCRALKLSASDYNISIGTAFNMRHKILRFLENNMNSCVLKGIIESDETYILESQKGCRNIRRPPRKRGGHASKRGLSDEQSCVIVSVERNGQAFARNVGFGKPSSDGIYNTLSNHIHKGSDLLTDGEKAYGKIVETNCLNHFKLESFIEYTKLLHINTVNSIHSRFKRMISNFCGVATRYLNQYCSLLSFIHQLRDMDNNERLSIILKMVNTCTSYYSVRECCPKLLKLV